MIDVGDLHTESNKGTQPLHGLSMGALPGAESIYRIVIWTNCYLGRVPGEGPVLKPCSEKKREGFSNPVKNRVLESCSIIFLSASIALLAF